MKPTIEGSNARNFNEEMAFISLNKKIERGFNVIQGASKNSIFDEGMTIIAEDSELRSNNTLKTKNGNIIKFEEKAFEKVKQHRKNKEEKGIVVNYEEIVEAKRRGRPAKQTTKTEEAR
ncbi:MAG: hypothetical protein HFJ41_04130 [Clostridia bacterium]|nr:hypothetical protein [Clostridia bacterium]